jgi:hypothetical protein
VAINQYAVGALFLATIALAGLSVIFATRGYLRRTNEQLKNESLDIERIVTNGIWTLIFNPSTGAGKQIRFAAGGDIGEGQNKNETRWRVRDGLLEILNDRGELFSRFRFDPKSRSFEHTNDSDTQSLRFQRLFRQDAPGLSANANNKEEVS